MEEILASIRRIISEDDAPAETAAAPAPEPEAAPAPEPEPAPSPALMDETPSMQEPEASEEDVLNLADTAAQFTARVPRLAFQLDEVVRALSDANAPASQTELPSTSISFAVNVLIDRSTRCSEMPTITTRPADTTMSTACCVTG